MECLETLGIFSLKKRLLGGIIAVLKQLKSFYVEDRAELFRVIPEEGKGTIGLNARKEISIGSHEKNPHGKSCSIMYLSRTYMAICQRD